MTIVLAENIHGSKLKTAKIKSQIAKVQQFDLFFNEISVMKISLKNTVVKTRNKERNT